MNASASTSRPRFAEFDARYIWASLTIALCGGFGIATFLGWQIGTQANLPRDFVVWVQVHGQLQLVGWIGLFIMGISLFFLPRLAGAPLPPREWHNLVLPLTAGGLVTATAARLLFARTPAEWHTALRAAVALGGIAEWLGLIGYIGMLAPVALHRSRGKNSGLEKLRPFFLMMVAGWVAYATLMAAFALVMAAHGDMVAPRGWNQWALDVEWTLVLFPVAYAFSVRNLPYFLYLPPVVAPVQRWGWAYLAAAVLTLTSLHPWSLEAAPRLALMLAAVGRVAKDGIILWLIADLNVFLRTRPLPYILAEKSPINPDPPPKPWRNWFNHANWGKPEWLIRSAYFWLVLGCGLDFVDALAHLTGQRMGFAPDVVRHIFLLGFITPLILGMAQKMVPGFLHRGRIAFPSLSHWIFLLVNVSVLGRVLPMILPPLPGTLLGLTLSGPLALVALALFGWNLWATARLPNSSPAH